MIKLIFSFLFIGISIISNCQGSDDSKMFYQRAISEINPIHVKWIKSKAAEADVSSQGISDLLTSARDYLNAAKTSGVVDPNALVQCVLRESFMQTTEDLRFYAEKVKYFNESKKLVRDHVQKLREYDTKMRESSRSQFESIKSYSNSIQVDLTPPSNPNQNRTIIRKDSLKTQTISYPINQTLVTKPVSPDEVELLIKELLLKESLLDQKSREASNRIQVLKDRAQKADSISTTLYKKFAASGNTIIANLK